MMSEYYQKHKEKILEYQRKYREKNKEKILAYQKNYQKIYYENKKDIERPPREKVSQSKLMNKRKRVAKALFKNEQKVEKYKQKLIDDAIALENKENDIFEENCLNAYPDDSSCILF
jgi:hypothetical protein